MKTFHVIEVGDRSVGLMDELTASLSVNNNMYTLMKEQNTVKDFKEDLKRLIESYFEPDTDYEVVEE